MVESPPNNHPNDSDPAQEGAEAAAIDPQLGFPFDSETDTEHLADTPDARLSDAVKDGMMTMSANSDDLEMFDALDNMLEVYTQLAAHGGPSTTSSPIQNPFVKCLQGGPNSQQKAIHTFDKWSRIDPIDVDAVSDSNKKTCSNVYPSAPSILVSAILVILNVICRKNGWIHSIVSLLYRL